MLPSHYFYQRGQQLTDVAQQPITITIPKRDWLQLMQVCQDGCQPDLAEWVADFSQTVETAIKHAETPSPYAAALPESQPEDLHDWLDTLIAHAD
jgi:hypothetical protein